MARQCEFSSSPYFTAAGKITGSGTQYNIQTPSGDLYRILCNGTTSILFTKSSDGGFTWSTPTSIASQSTNNLAVWYDRWSNISAGLIHVAYTETGTDDTHYRTIDTESSDALSTDTIIFAGSTTATGVGHLSITRSRGGNVYCKTVIDAGAEGGFFRLQNANVPNGAWDAARTVDEAIATTDAMILLPGFAADNQDIMAFFWDNSANEISRKLYDDSADTWSETSIATSMTKGSPANAFPHFAASVDLTNSRNLLVAWSNVDSANADLRFWTVTESAITETSTNVVLNSTDDQGLCGVGLDTGTGYWYVVYAGKSDGSETAFTSMNLYYKFSTDSGATWSAETALTSTLRGSVSLVITPRFFGRLMATRIVSTTTLEEYLAHNNMVMPRAQYIAGVI